MPTTITTTNLRPVLASADRAAGRFCRQHAGPLLEQDDVRQDLLLDLLTRLRSFDLARSSLATFATICFQHRAARLSETIRRDQRARHPAALDAPLPGQPELKLLDTIAESDGYGAWIGQPVDRQSEHEHRLDLDRALSAMSPDVVPLCAAILRPGRTQTGVGLSRTTIHRRLRELRCQLLAAGIGSHGGTNRSVAG